MKILVDADACPVKGIILKAAQKRGIPVLLFVDTSHLLEDQWGQVITVDKARDSVDFAIIGKLERGDIVVTQDYGLAAMALPKAAYVIHQNGFLFTKQNMDRLLFERHLSQELRRSGGRTKGPRKRSKEDDEKFTQSFLRILDEANNS